MAEGQKTNTHVVPQASQAMEQFKWQVASELGIQNYRGYLGDVPSRVNGAVGGHMVRRMIALAEQSLAEGGSIPPETQIRGTTGGFAGTTGGTTGGFGGNTGGTTGTFQGARTTR